jgi:hypothetical protein
VLVLMATLGVGCAPELELPEELKAGAVALALPAAPADAHCVRVTVAGERTVNRLFPVTPGRAAMLTFDGLPTGQVTVSEEAFEARCERVQTRTLPAWISEEPRTAVLAPWQAVELPVRLRPAGQVRARHDLQEGTLPAAFVVDEHRAELPPTTVGWLSPAVTFRVRNAGAGTAGPMTVMLVGAHAGDFIVTSNGCQGLEEEATCELTVVAQPSAAGPRQATLQIVADPGGLAQIALSVEGLTPASLRVSPGRVDFGIVPSGGRSELVALEVQNEGGTESEPLTALLQITSAGPLAFAIVSDGCAGARLAPGGTCTIVLRATPPTGLPAGFAQTALLSVEAPGAPAAMATLRVVHR